jgi:hypothetical protein
MWLARSNIVTRIEVLGFHRLRPDDDILLRVLLSYFDEYPISQQTAALGDALAGFAA